MLLCFDLHVLREGPSGDRLLDLLEQVLSVLVLPGGGRVSGNVLDTSDLVVCRAKYRTLYSRTNKTIPDLLKKLNDVSYLEKEHNINIHISIMVFHLKARNPWHWRLSLL